MVVILDFLDFTPSPDFPPIKGGELRGSPLPLWERDRARGKNLNNF